MKWIIHRNFVPTAGFTFIELTVVIVLVALLAGITIPSFINYANSQSLQAASSDVATLLQTAKTNAETEWKPTSNCPNVGNPCCTSSLDAYRVSLTSLTYSLAALCGGTAYPIESKKFSVASNISFSPTNNGAMIDFKVLSQGMDFHGGATPYIVTLRKGLNTSVITVSQFGTISQ